MRTFWSGEEGCCSSAAFSSPFWMSLHKPANSSCWLACKASPALLCMALCPKEFFSSLVLLGIGWNFLFVGGTTLMTEAYRPEERAKVQGLGDFLVFSTVAAASFSSGALNHAFGWQILNRGVLPLVAIVVVGLLWYRGQKAAVAHTV